MTTPPQHRLFRHILGEQTRARDPEERRVLYHMELALTVSHDAADVADERSSFGDRLADRVAAVGGSWSFIIAFAAVLFGWMLLNSDVLAHWDAAR